MVKLMKNNFLDDCKTILKHTQIITLDSKESIDYLYSCILVDRKVLGILKPKSTIEIKKIVDLANKKKISLYPFSTGKNWGYGTKIPVKNNCVLLDLSLMNKILDYNETLGYVRVEPGVTHRMLYEFLESKNSKLKIDPTGSSPDTSIIGNSLERGFGIGFLNNHFENLSNMEIVLPNGDLMKTGFGHYDNIESANVYKYGIGPFVDGLFSQSNFGIVTAANVYLSPKFEEVKLVVCKFDDDSKFEQVIDTLQILRFNEIIRSPVNVFYRNRLISVKRKFPFELTSNSNMSEEISKQLGVENSVSLWNISFSLFGTKKQVKVALEEVQKHFKKLNLRVFAFNNKQIENFKNSSKLIKFFTKLILKEDLEELSLVLKRGIGIFTGVPSNVSMPSPYWRSKVNYNDENPDPGRDNCGLYWISPVIPLIGERAREAFNIGKGVFDKYGFDFAPTYTFGGSRFIDNTIPLMYRKDDIEETKRANECYRELIAEFRKSGYMIYRASITSMDLIIDKKDTFWKFNKIIKEAIDKNNIISPGRYNLK